MNLFEMAGFLSGKCLPGDMKVGETNAEYLVRKFAELEAKLEEALRYGRQADITIDNLEAKYVALAAENAVKQEFIKTCFRAASDGASMDGADIQELGERLGLFGREIYQPVLHGYICGHEAGEDTVYVMKKTPTTEAFLAEVRAQGADAVAAYHAEREEAISEIAPFASRDHKNARVHAMDIAEQLRQEAK